MTSENLPVVRRSWYHCGISSMVTVLSIAGIILLCTAFYQHQKAQTVLSKRLLWTNPHFNETLLKETNTDSLQYLLDSTVDILESNGVVTWLDYGTLLSVWRDKMVIPDDSKDVDIAINFSDNERAWYILQQHLPLKSLEMCKKHLGPNPDILPGKHVVMETNISSSLWWYRIFPSALNISDAELRKDDTCSNTRPGLDVFSYSYCSDGFLCRGNIGFPPVFPLYGFSYVPAPVDYIFPLTYLNTSKRHYRVPGQTEKYLKFRYGCLGAIGSVCKPVKNLNKFYEPINPADSWPESNLTLVTGLWNIEDSTNNSDKRAFETYKYRWFPHMLKRVRFPMVIFVGDEEMVNWAMHLRGCNQTSEAYDPVLCRNTWVLALPKESFLVETGNIWIRDFLDTSKFLALSVKEKGKHNITAKLEHSHTWKKAILFQKPNLVNLALETNPFKSSYFAWIDAGFSHGTYNRIVHPNTADIISKEALSEGGILTLDGAFAPNVCQNLPVLFKDCVKFYSTDFMLASRETWKETVRHKFYEYLIGALKMGMLPDEQAVYGSMACENSSLIHVPCMSSDTTMSKPNIEGEAGSTFHQMMKFSTSNNKSTLGYGGGEQCRSLSIRVCLAASIAVCLFVLFSVLHFQTCNKGFGFAATLLLACVVLSWYIMQYIAVFIVFFLCVGFSLGIQKLVKGSSIWLCFIHLKVVLILCWEFLCITLGAWAYMWLNMFSSASVGVFTWVNGTHSVNAWKKSGKLLAVKYFWHS